MSTTQIQGLPVAEEVKSGPLKTLGWRTPAEAFNEHLRLNQEGGFAWID
jgi:IS30 family transposase